MATPCEAAQAVYGQLPHLTTSRGDSVDRPEDWAELGVSTMSTMVALTRGFRVWYAAPTDGCQVYYFLRAGETNPFEDPEWRASAVLTLIAWLEGAQGEEGKQAGANYLLGADRSLLRVAIASEDEPTARGAWLLLANVVGIVGIRETLLQIAERGGMARITAAADTVLANWLPLDVDGDALRRAENAARLALAGDGNGADAVALRNAGLNLLKTVQLIQSHQAGGEIPTTQPPPPTGIVPRVPSTWWETSWPIVAGGAGGVLLLIAAWLHRRRATAV